ncbi:uncharacterized protein F5Z01DRAFT_557051 [Emericellopsis atlantica]|uniref:NAD(P)-binding domain-containing protein n=1 Tax=Emericellopsis atlantica TaxID=2614577 RepID=A0A9P7ZPF0_9HYPO|nr:uncharacterized protein F5Z01DRAFT_557051 [Emericellopsis atlantica]KAG9255760.1 hypothetical protein F5Z01DRAFT_557051 [Emericellopsis atlantica]
MKVLIAGATGGIGSQALRQSLAHPRITKVVTFTRRSLSLEHPKLESILIKNFEEWPEHVLSQHADAAGIIWCIGSYSGDEKLDFEYSVAFMEAMVQVLDAKKRDAPFRYVHLSGKFVRQDQSLNLWWGDRPRKLKGKSDTAALEMAEKHAAAWHTHVVKPGGVAHHPWQALGVWLMGDNWAVRGQELGAFMAYLVVDGQGESSTILNNRIAQKGRALLREA